jgi:Flp pilus assembly pilin Flp
MLDEHGAVLVEYALVLALLSLAFMGGMSAIEVATSAAYTYVTGELLDYAERNGN